MRLLVLIAALVLSAGSFHTANQRYALNTYSCNSVQNPVQQQACYNRANTRYVVESQEELVAAQNARADAQVAAQDQRRRELESRQLVTRCETVAQELLACGLIQSGGFTFIRNQCIYAFNVTTTRFYGEVLCYERTVDCAGMKRCLAN